MQAAGESRSTSSQRPRPGASAPPPGAGPAVTRRPPSSAPPRQRQRFDRRHAVDVERRGACSRSSIVRQAPAAPERVRSWRCGSVGVPLTDGRPPRVSSSRSSAVENLARAFDDRRGQAGQARHLDAVAPIRAAGHDLPEKDDVVLPLARGDVIVDDARRGVGEIGQLVVVRREQRLRPQLRVRGEDTRRPPRRCSGRRRSPCRGRSRRARPGFARSPCAGCSPSPASRP